MKRSTWVATGFVILVALAAGGYGYWQQRSAKGVAAAEASSSAREAAGGSGAGNPARGASGAGAVGAPAVSVSIVKAVTRDQPVLLDATGTVVALNMVDVRPQVVGHGVGKRLELAIDRGEFGSPFLHAALQRGVEFVEVALGAFADFDVANEPDEETPVARLHHVVGEFDRQFAPVAAQGERVVAVT